MDTNAPERYTHATHDHVKFCTAGYCGGTVEVYRTELPVRTYFNVTTLSATGSGADRTGVPVGRSTTLVVGVKTVGDTQPLSSAVSAASKRSDMIRIE